MNRQLVSFVAWCSFPGKRLRCLSYQTLSGGRLWRKVCSKALSTSPVEKRYPRQQMRPHCETILVSRRQLCVASLVCYVARMCVARTLRRLYEVSLSVSSADTPTLRDNTWEWTLRRLYCVARMLRRSYVTSLVCYVARMCVARRLRRSYIASFV